jgi:hypothetical protein
MQGMHLCAPDPVVIPIRYSCNAGTEEAEHITPDRFMKSLYDNGLAGVLRCNYRQQQHLFLSKKIK